MNPKSEGMVPPRFMDFKKIALTWLYGDVPGKVGYAHVRPVQGVG